MADQPTPPNLGNLTDAQFLALIDWNRTPANQPGPNGEDPAPDTWVKFNTCVIALQYRLMLENFRYLNRALACEVPTPLCTLAQQPVGGAPDLPTDYNATAAEANTTIGLADQPAATFPLDGRPFNIAPAQSDRINSNSVTNDLVWSVVVAHSGHIGDPHTVLGLRNHGQRWYFSDDNPVFRSKDIAFQIAIHIPEWPQDTGADIVLAKVGNYLTEDETGMANRMGFEIGLGKGQPNAGIQDSRDYCLYLRWFNSSDEEQRVSCVILAGVPATTEPIGLTPGRRFTVGFHRFEESFNVWKTRFFVNGIELGRPSKDLEEPSVGTSSNIRLHLGSGQLGKSYTGGPFNNVVVWNNPSQAGIEGAMKTMYARTEGFAETPTGGS